MGRINLLLIFAISIFIVLHQQPTAQTQKSEAKPQEPIWKTKLYEQNVEYENFACSQDDAETITSHFKNRPLNVKLPICHNDCPIIKCRPVVPFPVAAKTARVSGTASVHVLVDEAGKVLYARVLTGHLLLLPALKKAACETKFNGYSDRKRQGVMHFTIEDYDYLNVPYRANYVW